MADSILTRPADFYPGYYKLTFTDLGKAKLGIGGSIGNLVYIQSTAPAVAPGTPYLWIDTSGGNLNFWVEDGV